MKLVDVHELQIQNTNNLIFSADVAIIGIVLQQLCLEMRWLRKHSGPSITIWPIYTKQLIAGLMHTVMEISVDEGSLPLEYQTHVRILKNTTHKCFSRMF